MHWQSTVKVLFPRAAPCAAAQKQLMVPQEIPPAELSLQDLVLGAADHRPVDAL